MNMSNTIQEDTERAQDEREERLTAFIESLQVSNPPFLREIEKEALADGVPIIRPQTQSLLQFLLQLKKPMRILEVGTAVGFSALFMHTFGAEDMQLTTIERDPERIRKARENFRKAGLKEIEIRTATGTEIETETKTDAGRTPETSSKAGTTWESGPESAADIRNREEQQTDEELQEKRYDYQNADGSVVLRLLTGDAAKILPSLQEEFDFIFMDAAKGQYIRFLPETERLLPVGGVMLSDNILQEGEILTSKFMVTRRNRTIHKRMREYLYALTHSSCWQTIVISNGDGAAISVRK